MTAAGNDISPVKPGEILAGRYRIDRVIGVGGMGVVVSATHLQLDQPVAIKFLLQQALMHPEIVARFSREARAAVKIRSEHVAKVMDVGELDNGSPYMVMEFLDGRDLYAVMRAAGQLSVEQAIDYMLQASVAIAEAHGLGIVHRDLKPANLFVVETQGVGIIKVLDFGISKMSGFGDAGGMTQSASILGSPAYMSPEHMGSARDVDGRTDVWALGVILYELLAGVKPFEGESITELCIAITQRPPKPIEVNRPDLPRGLAAVVMRCLEKDRERRFQTVEDFALALADYAPPRARLSLERLAIRAKRDASNTPVLSKKPKPREETVALDGLPVTPLGLGSSSSSSSSSSSAQRGSRPGSVPGVLGTSTTERAPSTQAGWGNTDAGTRASGGRTAVIVVATLIGLGAAAAAVLHFVGGPDPASVASGAAPPSASAVMPPGAPPAPKVEPAAKGAPEVIPVAPTAADAPPPVALPSQFRGADESASGLGFAKPAAGAAQRPAAVRPAAPRPASLQKPHATTPAKKDEWEDDR